MGMTREEIIADERYHTCGRCRWGDLNEDYYPCNKCIHSVDKREDFWQYAEEVEDGKKVIDADGAKEILYVSKDRIANNLRNQITSYIRENYIPKADYENRLKTDMVAMLTEIQLDIEKHTMTSGVTNQFTWNECIACCSRAIQQKINELKAESEKSKHV